MASKEGSRVCPVCGQPVEPVQRRHKTLGVFVLARSPGPCRNPQCERYVEEEAEEGPGAPAAQN